MSSHLAPIQTGDPVRLYAARLAGERRRRTRRRLGALGAMLLLGLALGTVYATGFATVGGSDGTTSTSPELLYQAPDAQDTSGLNALLSAPNGPLNFNWQGRTGTVSTKVLYVLDLTGPSTPNTDKFYSEVLLTNTPAGFSDLQIQFRIGVDGADNACDPTDLTSTASSNFRKMIFDTTDAQVTFSGLGGATTGLPGNERYCIGVVNYTGAGTDPNGTFIRKTTSGANFTGTYPTFVSTLNRMP